MMHIAAALLTLPDGLFVVQRRSEHAKFAGGRLGFFGGKVEEGETPLEALKRELRAKTSLDVAELKFEEPRVITLSGAAAHREDTAMHLFPVIIQAPTFTARDGSAEVHPPGDLRSRIDLTDGLRAIVDHL